MRSAVRYLGLVGFVAELGMLGALRWHDAWVASAFDAWRGCQADAFVAGFTQVAPYLGAAIVAAGAAVALRRGATVGDVLWVLVLLGLGLLLAQGLKLGLDRPRPGVPPWHLTSSSFPSGHVANATLCVGAALLLAKGEIGAGRALRLAIVIGGGLFVVAVAASRMYLGRHWMTDVTASALLGVGFWGLVGDRPASARRWVPATVVAAALCVVGAAGGRIRLGSPASLAGESTLDVALEDAGSFAAPGLVARWVPRAGDSGGFLRLDGASALRFGLRVEESRRAVLEVVGRRMNAAVTAECRWIELLLDGRVVAGAPLRTQWWTYAFALPAMERGWHELRLRTLGANRTESIEGTLRIRRIALDGMVGAITPGAASASPPAAAVPEAVGRRCG